MRYLKRALKQLGAVDWPARYRRCVGRRTGTTGVGLLALRALYQLIHTVRKASSVVVGAGCGGAVVPHLSSPIATACPAALSTSPPKAPGAVPPTAL